VAVEVLAGSLSLSLSLSLAERIVVCGSACRAVIWTSRESTPACMAVTKECLSMCGCGLAIGTPAVSASRRRRRVAAAVHPDAAAVEQDRPAGTAACGPFDGPAGCWRQRDQDDLGALPYTRSTRWPCSSPRSAMFAPVASKIRRPSNPSMATSAKSHGFGDWRAVVMRASNCRWVNPPAALEPG
jgi:hypothetical protein